MKSLLMIVLFLLLVPGSISPTDDLIAAVERNDFEKAKMAIQNGADVNFKDYNGAPILWTAAYKADLNMVKLLIDKDAKYGKSKGIIDFKNEFAIGNLLSIAVCKFDLEMLEYFVDSLKISVDDQEWDATYRSFTGWTAAEYVRRVRKLNLSTVESNKLDNIQRYLNSKKAKEMSFPEDYEEDQIMYLAIDSTNKFNTSFEQIKRIKSLRIDLTHKDAKIPEAISLFENLEELGIFSARDLTKESPVSLPASIRDLKNLIYFTCSGLGLTKLPDFKSKQLRQIDVSNNRISSLPNSIAKLPELSYLNCSNNQLKVLPDFDGAFAQLSMLIAHDNDLKKLPESPYSKLFTLNLNNNALSTMPVWLSKLKFLEEFEIRDNPIEVIPEEMSTWLIQNYFGSNKRAMDYVSNLIDNAREAKEKNLRLQDSLEAQRNRAILQTEIERREAKAKSLEYEITRTKDQKEKDSLIREKEKNEAAIAAAKLEKEKIEANQKAKEAQYQKELLEKNQKNSEEKNRRIQDQQNSYFILAIIIIAFIFFVVAFSVYIVLQKRYASKQRKANELLREQAAEIEAASNELKGQAIEMQEKNNELESLSEELRQQNEVVSEQMHNLESLQQTKDLMISSVNHDLRNPLNPILNYSSSTYPEKDKTKLLAMIHERAETMFGLINDIMDVYRADKLKIESFPNSPYKAVQEAIQSISEARGDIPEIINEMDRELMVLFEFKYIERVFENLLSNAVKYSDSKEEGGKVIFRSTVLDDTVVRLSIEDNGQGIPESQFKEIFEPFSNPNAKSIGAAKSVGIGLTFCKTIIEAHKSQIGIRSTVGEGTTFYFDLPIYVETKVHQKADDTVKSDDDFVLTDDIKTYLKPYIEELSTKELYEITILEEVLSRIENKDLNILKWKELLQESINNYDEELFKELCNI